LPVSGEHAGHGARPLRYRTEIISLAGYIEREKLQIARRYLVARQLTANGLTQAQVALDDNVLPAIIHGYTREAGVCSLEREIGRLLRHAAIRIAEGSDLAAQETFKKTSVA
jgi:ATP-dependent Lon protease